MDTGKRVLTVGEVIDQRPLSSFQVSTMVLCGLVLVLDGFDTQCIGFLAPSIAENFHVPMKDFGPALAAGLVGIMIASMTTGPIADRWGRKWAVVGSTLTFALFAILTARVTTLHELVFIRFLTGLGLGGALPNVVALASEYAPKRLLQIFVTLLFCGMPMGALLGGIVSSVMLPRWGWQSVFYAGGILPLLVALVLIKALPESIRFLSVSGAESQELARIMARISSELGDPSLKYAHEDQRKGMPVKHLFTEGRAAGTLVLWIPFFMNLLILYFIVSWLPGLLRQAQLPVSAGIAAVSVFSLGGILGCLVQGRMMNWSSSIMVAEFVLCAAFIGSLAYITSFPLVIGVTLLLGLCVQGAQAGLNALAAGYYSTSIRSTGVGWALGIGRLGSIVGPVMGGAMLTAGWSPRQIFLAGAIPGLCAAIAIMLSNLIQGNSSAYRAAPDTSIV